MATIGSYVAEFTAKVDGLVQGVDKVNTSLDSMGTTIAKSLLSVAAIQATATAAFSAIAAAVESAVIATANYGDEILAMSKKTGVATDTLGGLIFAFQQGNATQEELTASLKGLSTNLEAASEDSKKQAAAFQFLGVSTKDVTGHLRPMNDVLLDVADRFQALPDGAEKAALATAIFGKSGAALIPTLNEGSRGIREQTELAQRFGAVMSGEAAEAGDRFNDALGETQLALRGLSFAIGEQLLPALTVLIRSMNEWIASATKAIKSSALLELAFRAITSPFGMLITQLQQAGAQLKTGADLAFEYGERVKALAGVSESFAESQKKAAEAAAALKKALTDDARLVASEQQAIWDEFVRQNKERDDKEAERRKKDLALQESEQKALADQIVEIFKDRDSRILADLKIAASEQQAIFEESARQAQEVATAAIKLNQDISSAGIELWKKQQKQVEESTKAMSVALGNVTSDFAKAFTDIIFEGAAFSDAMTNLFKVTAKSLLNAFITGLISPLTDELAKLGRSISKTLSDALGAGGAGGGLGGILGALGGGLLGPIGLGIGAFGLFSSLFGRGGNNTPAQPNSIFVGPTGASAFAGGGTPGPIPTYGPESPAYLANQRPINSVINIYGSVGVSDIARQLVEELRRLTGDSGMVITGAH